MRPIITLHIDDKVGDYIQHGGERYNEGNELDNYNKYGINPRGTYEVSAKEFEGAKALRIVYLEAEDSMCRFAYYNTSGSIDSTSVWELNETIGYCTEKLVAVFDCIPSTIYYKEVLQ